MINIIQQWLQILLRQCFDGLEAPVRKT